MLVEFLLGLKRSLVLKVMVLVLGGLSSTLAHAWFNGPGVAFQAKITPVGKNGKPTDSFPDKSSIRVSYTGGQSFQDYIAIYKVGNSTTNVCQPGHGAKKVVSSTIGRDQYGYGSNGAEGHVIFSKGLEKGQYVAQMFRQKKLACMGSAAFFRVEGGEPDRPDSNAPYEMNLAFYTLNKPNYIALVNNVKSEIEDAFTNSGLKVNVLSRTLFLSADQVDAIETSTKQEQNSLTLFRSAVTSQNKSRKKKPHEFAIFVSAQPGSVLTWGGKKRNAAGVAWGSGRFNSAQAFLKRIDSAGYALVSRNARYVGPHELGHMLGLSHGNESSSNVSSFARGWRYGDDSDYSSSNPSNSRSIMRYGASYRAVNRYSSKKALGTAKRDATRYLAETTLPYLREIMDDVD